MKRIVVIFGIIAGLVFCIYFNFKPMIDSHLKWAPGDPTDERAMVFLLNHWYEVFAGREHFFRVNYFYPDRLALGYADAVFLLGIVYSLFRCLKLDYFTSLQYMYVFMVGFGYVGSVLFFRKVLGLSFVFGILGAILLVVLNALQNQYMHAQLMGFYFYPILAYLLGMYLKSAKVRAVEKSWMYISSFSVLLGLIFFTSYYPAWFFVFTVLILGFVYATLKVAEHTFGQFVRSVYVFVQAERKRLIVALTIFMLSLTPFFVTYLPVAMSSKGFSVQTMLHYSPSIEDVINLGRNRFWPSVLHYSFDSGNCEVENGYPLFTLSFFLLFLLLCLRDFTLRKQRVNEVMLAFGLTAVVILLITVKWSNQFSLWLAIYHLIPGATGIRAVGRYLIVSQMLGVVFVSHFIDRMCFKDAVPTSLGAVRILLFVILFISLIVEQTNVGYFRLYKEGYLNSLRGFSRKINCRCFFLSPVSNPSCPMYAYNVDAMMVAMKTGVPTMNGYSAVYPAGWALFNVASPLYLSYVYSWVRNNGIATDVCMLNLSEKKFVRVNVLELEELSGEKVMQFCRQFERVCSIVSKFVSSRSRQKELFPSTLVKAGLLNDSFRSKCAKGNWAVNGYWIGWWGDKDYAVGYFPATRSIAEELSKVFKGRAKRIYFPYPEVFNPRGKERCGLGEVLIVFGE